MKRLVSVAMLTAFILAATAQAGTVSFGTNKDGSTLTWETLVNTHRDHPEVTTEITVLDATSARMRGIYNGGGAGDSAMYTALTLNAGDTVNFDWFLSNNSNNIPEYNGGTWVGDATFQFKAAVESGSFPILTERFYVNNTHVAYNNGAEWIENLADLNTGLHIEYIMGETEYTLNVTSLVDPFTSSTTTLAYKDGATVSDIQCFRVGIWDSEQDVTVMNFGVTPEPTTLALLGLGALVLRRRK